MQNKKWLAVVAVGLGVLTGTAQAATMKMTIKGQIADALNYDQGNESVWNLPQDVWSTNKKTSLYTLWLSKLTEAERNTKGQVEIEVLFGDTFITPTPYDSTKTLHTYGPSSSYGSVIRPGTLSASVTFNGVTQTISSSSDWSLQDMDVGTNKGDDRLVLNIHESKANWNAKRFDSTITLKDSSTSFAQGSMAFLQQFMLGQVTSLNNSTIKSGVLTFEFQQSGKYNSKLNITPSSISIAPVPEPETWAMMAAGLGLIGFATRRRSR